jgi:hypothetical protein
MVASRQAASLLGSSTPSVSRREPSRWKLKKYLDIRGNAGPNIKFRAAQEAATGEGVARVPNITGTASSFPLRIARQMITTKNGCQKNAPPTEAVYSVKAAKTNVPTKTAKAIAIRARKNLAMTSQRGIALFVRPALLTARPRSGHGHFRQRVAFPASQHGLLLTKPMDLA